MISINNTNNKKANDNVFVNLRLVGVGVVATLCLVIVICSLINIQFVKGKEYSEKAHNQQVKSQIISPNRGTIYDTCGEILAQSIPVDTVSLNPGMITYSSGKKVENEVIAQGMSEIFNVTYDEMMEKLQSNKSVVVVEKKVEKDIVNKLKEWMTDKKITSGINIDEDSKRYYPYNNLASNLIGFCGTDNSGQNGLEERWDKILTGTAGKIVGARTANKQAISDEYEQYVASENGSNIYLTIDTKIQSICEKYLSNALIQNSSADSGTAIVMNPQSGDILAMVTKPDFNLNSPSSFTNTNYSEEEWQALDGASRTNILLNLWKNKAVSGTYEPGSTFKLITASVGLEEGFVETDKAGDFLCTGSYKVGEEEIGCWRTLPHGSQSLREALCNSCNPAFMQLGQRIGAKTLYKYFQAFGLLGTVGNDIAKAYPGTFYDLNKIAAVELATTSFGQRFEISPLQLISAISAICNDGILVKPKIVKQIENTDTKSIEIIKTEEIRQVISKDTADKVKKMMQSVVTDGTGRNAAIEGYSIGGKSGTSEPRRNHEQEGYVASFVAISPIENTQVIVLVALYGLSEKESHQGGQVAGPVAHDILKGVLPYLGITSTSTADKENINNIESILISVPNVKNQTVSEAIKKLQQLGFNVKCNVTENLEQVKVVDQIPKYGVALNENAVICLYTENEEKTKVKVPNLKDMTADQATNALKERNLNIKIDGKNGVVISQDPVFEAEVEEGTIINVVVKEKLVSAQ